MKVKQKEDEYFTQVFVPDGCGFQQFLDLIRKKTGK